MFNRNEIEQIGSKLERSNVSQDVAEQVSDLIDACYDNQTGIRACDFLLGNSTYRSRELELEPHDNYFEAISSLQAASNLCLGPDFDYNSDLDRVRYEFIHGLGCASLELESLIHGTDLSFPKSLGWEDYDQWNEDFGKKCEEFAHLWDEDQDKWHDTYKTAQAKEFMKHPRMWIYDNNVYVPGLAESKDDVIRKYIAKNTVWPQIRKEFAAYA